MAMIGFVGLGTIGAVAAGSIYKAGYPVMVYDIRAEAVQSYVTHGAQSARSPNEVARQCPIVFTSLPGPPEGEQVALGSIGLLQGVHEGSL